LAGLLFDYAEEDAELFKVVRRFYSGSRFTYFLDRGKQQPNQDGYDGYYYEQFDEREAGVFTGCLAGSFVCEEVCFGWGGSCDPFRHNHDESPCGIV